MMLLFFIVAIGSFVSLLAAEYGATGKNGTAYFLIRTSTNLATLAIVGAAVAGLYLALSILLWLLSILF